MNACVWVLYTTIIQYLLVERVTFLSIKFVVSNLLYLTLPKWFRKCSISRVALLTVNNILLTYPRFKAYTSSLMWDFISSEDILTFHLDDSIFQSLTLFKPEASQGSRESLASRVTWISSIDRKLKMIFCVLLHLSVCHINIFLVQSLIRMSASLICPLNSSCFIAPLRSFWSTLSMHIKTLPQKSSS